MLLTQLYECFCISSVKKCSVKEGFCKTVINKFTILWHLSSAVGGKKMSDTWSYG